ncbi:MAG: hypothetical protein VW644_10805 [Alphaproteobacteria bacterium]
MTLGIRQRRAERQRRWRVIRGFLIVGGLAVYSFIAYQTGAEISHGRIAGLESEIARLAARESELGERGARLEVELAAVRNDLAQWQTRYDADVPSGKAHDLMLQTEALLDDGVAADRIARMIAAAGARLDCSGDPATRRFLVRTPIYSGANDAVNAITVTARGASASNSAGQPEAWFDPAKPVTLRVSTLGGESSEATGLLPLHHAVLWDDAEYRFSVVAAGQRGFVLASADRCDLP